MTEQLSTDTAISHEAVAAVSLADDKIGLFYGI
jgi:hypothetical protein